jgi:preprotein translocase subunit SecD
VDTQHDPAQAQTTGLVPPGSLLEHDRQGRPVLLQREVIVSGDQLINAISSVDPTTSSPAVLVTLNSQGAQRMAQVTQSNIGKPMAVVYMEYKPIKTPPGAPPAHRLERQVISVATIQSAFSSRFQITGLARQEAHTPSLLLRAGSLAAPLQIIEERTVGPSLGKANVQSGLLAGAVGTGLILLFMAIYYRAFGLIAGAALLLNLILLVGLLSLLGVTLTLPGIAGIVLTLGMAVDANVLINERIREELDAGLAPQASIRAGYDRAFATITDSNLTTLIAALILFVIGTGPIKGFAVTLSAGIATSMFSAVFGSRSLVDLIFGGRRLGSLSI